MGAPEESTHETERTENDPPGLRQFRSVLLEIRDDAERKRYIEELRHLWNRPNISITWEIPPTIYPS